MTWPYSRAKILKIQRLVAILLLVIVSQNGIAGEQQLSTPVPFYPLGPGAWEGSAESLVLGTLKKIEQPEQRQGTIQGRIQVMLTITIERTMLGPPLPQQELILESVWYDPSRYLASGELGHPRVGDQVFYQYRANEDRKLPELFRRAPLGQAVSVEIDRIERAKQIIAMKDSQQAAQRTIAGCVDPDPHFAIWCLSVHGSYPKQSGDLRHERVYGAIRAWISEEQYSSLLWKILQDPSTHPAVYQFVDQRLAQRELTVDEHEMRHRSHLRRFATIFTEPDGVNYRVLNNEIRYLLCDSYSKTPGVLRRAALTELEKQITPDVRIEYRSSVIRFAGGLYVPKQDIDQEATYAAVLHFHRQFHPLHHPERQIPAISYCAALDGLMRRYSDSKRKICEDGFDLLVELIVGGDENSSWIAASKLTSYADHCRRKKIDWILIKSQLETARDLAPHAAAKKILTVYLQRWEDADETVRES
ncbi:hypothetical protein [Blastopirellula marina]|uniref:Uncharacterized protein n=1 Tax=Blastopirellula marina DSM 3645 TaxID=314230 RepID=A3ZR45_9BACT|nr:hypothetical protein [Blastopirellula marina]EAQ81138.1 hypothetical protein DSM3645_21242 [Blastopirellula marina DSM 3645]